MNDSIINYNVRMYYCNVIYCNSITVHQYSDVTISKVPPIFTLLQLYLVPLLKDSEATTPSG